MRKTALILFFIAIIFLYGCFHHSYRSRPLALQSTDLAKNVKEAFSTESVCSGFYPNQAWWSFFKDSQLDHLVELSLACHPDIKIADARIRLAYNEAMVARSSLLPQFSLFGNAGRAQLGNLFPDVFEGASPLYTLTLNSAFYELDIWNKNRSLYYAALDEAKAQIADLQEAKLLLSTAVTATYFNLQMSRARLTLNQRRLEAREEVYSLLEQQFQLGIISEFFLYQTDTEVQLIKDLIDQLEAEVAIDIHALAALVGNVSCYGGNLEAYLQAPSARFDTPFPLPQTLPIDLLARRPDITAQKWRVEASCFKIKSAQAEFYPSVDLIAFFGLLSFKFSELFTDRSIGYLGQALGVLPLYTAGKLKARLGIAQETLEIAVESYNQTVLRAVQEVSDSLTQLITTDERSQSLQRSIEDAQELSDLTHQRYANGVAGRIPVLNAIENLLIQKDLEIQIQLLRYLSAVDLVQCIGGGYYDCDCK